MDRYHPDFAAACQDAQTSPEIVLSDHARPVIRRAVACRLGHKGWKPGRIAKLFNVTRRTVERWGKLCPSRFNIYAWRQSSRDSQAFQPEKAKR